jgi:Methyltransferase domain
MLTCPMPLSFPKKGQVLEHAIQQARTDGLFLEFGVWSGRTINYIAERHDGLVHGFDSFEGLPEDWAMQYRRGDFATNGRLPAVRSNVRLHVGWFDQTLPRFLNEHNAPVAFMHVDCDLYSSTRTIFELLGDRIAPGTVIVFDEYFNYPGWREHEFKAFQEFIAASRLRYRYLAYNQRQYNVATIIEE